MNRSMQELPAQSAVQAVRQQFQETDAILKADVDLESQTEAAMKALLCPKLLSLPEVT